MSDFDLTKDVLFVGLGASPVAYYRCFLPALELGADWMGIAGDPPKLHQVTGLIKRQSGVMPDLTSDYKVVVLQQVRGKEWVKLIHRMREAGVKVVYEIDDYLHGIKHMKGEHGYQHVFTNKLLAEIEQAMRACDAVITTTEWIKESYKHLNKQIYICENGIDLARYDLTRPERKTVNIGWSGGTGHVKAMGPWLKQVAQIMQMRPQTTFVSVGEPFAKHLAKHFGERRALAIPWATIEQYPSAMMMFDIALAPAGSGGWWRGKSQLRWLEASGLGIPIVADPRNYPNIVDGETGFLAENPDQAGQKILHLIDQPEIRRKVGEQAREHVRENYSIEKIAPQWLEAFEQVLSS